MELFAFDGINGLYRQKSFSARVLSTSNLTPLFWVLPLKNGGIPHTPGKLSEGLTDFASKDGTLR